MTSIIINSMKKLNTLIVLLLVFIPSFLSAQFGCVPQNENNNLQGDRKSVV